MEFNCRIAGSAGEGVNVIGRTFGKMFTRGGFNVIGYPEYPSLVRGGHNVYHMRVSDKDIHAPTLRTDLVIAINKDAVTFHKDAVAKGGGIIYDSGIDIAGMKFPEGVSLYPLDFSAIVQKAGGLPQMKNVAALGAAMGIVGYPFGMLEESLKQEFGRKGDQVVKQNVDIAKAAYDASSHFKTSLPKMKPVSQERKIFISGNEAVAMGAVSAGMKLFSGYPMTPSSSVMHYLAEKERDFGIVVKHVEDEISAVLYAIGASYAGVRAFTATSGGGFSLMAESLGLSALSETPIVVYVAQRPGPSTCLPTWTEQGDLRFALHASQGSFLRVLFAPGDMEECFALTALAFNLADKFQLPALVLGDKFNGESNFSVDRFPDTAIDRGKIVSKPKPLAPNERFHRYELTKDGVSPRPLPGTPDGMHVATSYEHDESGYSSEDFGMRTAQVDKRARKLKALLKEIPLPGAYGSEDPEVTLICWGSQKLPARDALPLLAEKGIKANLIHFSCIFPNDWKKIRKLLKASKKTIILENNPDAQFAGILKQYASFKPDSVVLKYDGRPFFPEEIAKTVSELKEKKYKAKGGTVHVRDEDYEYFKPHRYSGVGKTRGLDGEKER
ncbi:MAG: 2-oxoacid:acceptor oxidoreductase subunit alpha [Candidatus Bilamarchaeaceae archaeon]